MAGLRAQDDRPSFDAPRPGELTPEPSLPADSARHPRRLRSRQKGRSRSFRALVSAIFGFRSGLGAIHREKRDAIRYFRDQTGLSPGPNPLRAAAQPCSFSSDTFPKRVQLWLNAYPASPPRRRRVKRSSGRASKRLRLTRRLRRRHARANPARLQFSRDEAHS